MRIRETSILILPGRNNSPPDHWQSRWETRISTAQRVDQHDWVHPQKTQWLAAITRAIEDAHRPVVLVTHSLGGIAAIWAAHHVPQGKIAGAFIVAPPSEEVLRATPEVDAAFVPVPHTKLPFPSVMVASRNDPRADFAWSEAFAASLGAEFVDAGEAGHINADSGFGPWPEGLMRFGAFLQKLNM